MKRISVLLVVLLLVSGITYAQERGAGGRPSQASPQGRPGGGPGGPGGNRQQMNPEEMLKMQTQRLVEQYKLNKDQETKVTAINKKYSQNQTTDFSRMRDASDAERTKMRDAMQKVQADRNKEIRAVLTPDQAKLFDENQKKMEEQRRNGQGRMGGFGGPQ